MESMVMGRRIQGLGRNAKAARRSMSTSHAVVKRMERASAPNVGLVPLAYAPPLRHRPRTP
ncbi:hypothetical protein BC938DRAFT_478003 [Jimgerdemannia flammicorona]|uniref:Uncharacterized protein n=1 Tax=Jimgerdemannia flammicorona TaxID=994334 RepID=A0A433P6V7_9FUNG|nr:hypothetical protein BC938DRAFT_478003 [Jimgerdemannia flammicorona]